MGCSSSRPAGPRPPGANVTRAGQPHPHHQQQQQSNAALAAPTGGPPPRAKLVLLGDSGVGKSCLVMRHTRGQFDAASKITVGAAFSSCSVALPSGASLRLEVWDTAGQERYLSLAPLYYRGAHAALVVYSVSSAESFAKARYWVGELRKNAGASIVIALVGNKSDLAPQREVSAEEGEAFAREHGMMFFEASAKTAANVAAVFEGVAARLVGGGGGGGGQGGAAAGAGAGAGGLPVSSSAAPVPPALHA